MTVTGPRKWCTPSNAFGQLSLSKSVEEGGIRRVRRVPVVERVWNPPSDPTDHEKVAEFRAAVMQNAIAVHVRTAKNSMPHPRLEDRTFPLQALVDLDPRSSGNLNRWQGKLTGRYAMTPQDIVTLMEILPGSLPSEREIKVFLDVAQKRISPPSGWNWPDS